MKKWWNDIRKLEDYLLKRMPHQQHEALKKSLILWPEAKDMALHQSTTYEAVRWYGRQKLKKNLKTLNQQLLHTPKEGAIAQEIKTLFEHH